MIGVVVVVIAEAGYHASPSACFWTRAGGRLESMTGRFARRRRLESMMGSRAAPNLRRRRPVQSQPAGRERRRRSPWVSRSPLFQGEFRRRARARAGAPKTKSYIARDVRADPRFASASCPPRRSSTKTTRKSSTSWIFRRSMPTTKSPSPSDDFQRTPRAERRRRRAGRRRGERSRCRRRGLGGG